MYLYMCSFLETKSVALTRGRPPQKKRNVTTDDTPFLYKVSLILKDLANI